MRGTIQMKMNFNGKQGETKLVRAYKKMLKEMEMELPDYTQAMRMKFVWDTHPLKLNRKFEDWSRKPFRLFKKNEKNKQ